VPTDIVGVIHVLNGLVAREGRGNPSRKGRLFRSPAGRAEARTNRQPPGSYPSLQWGAGSTPDARPDPVTVTVQLPAEA
jgi:hypothetical protein